MMTMMTMIFMLITIKSMMMMMTIKMIALYLDLYRARKTCNYLSEAVEVKFDWMACNLLLPNYCFSFLYIFVFINFLYAFIEKDNALFQNCGNGLMEHDCNTAEEVNEQFFPNNKFLFSFQQLFS